MYGDDDDDDENIVMIVHGSTGFFISSLQSDNEFNIAPMIPM
jgi:hypothetical protein